MDSNLLPVYASAPKRGPIYSTLLIEALPLGDRTVQACPTRADLDAVKAINVTTVAGYEILLRNYHEMLTVVVGYEATIADLTDQIVVLQAQVVSLQSLLPD